MKIFPSLVLAITMLLSSCYDTPKNHLTELEKEYVAVTTVRVGVEVNFAPFIYYDEDNQLVGVSKEFLDLAAERVGLKLKYVPVGQLSAVMSELKNRDIDLVTSLKKTLEREAFIEFTNPYVTVATVMLIREGAMSNGFRVGFGSGFAIEKFLRERKSEFILEPYKDDTAAFKAMIAQNLEGVVLDVGSAAYLQTKYNTDYSRSPVSFSYDLAFGVQKDDAMLKALLNKGLQSITPAETRRIQQKYFKASQP